MTKIESLPSRERGLKSPADQPTLSAPASLPSRERGLKLSGTEKEKDKEESLPSRERGLKLQTDLQTLWKTGRSLRGSVD